MEFLSSTFRPQIFDHPRENKTQRSNDYSLSLKILVLDQSNRIFLWIFWYLLLLGPLNVPISHGSQVVEPEKCCLGNSYTAACSLSCVQRARLRLWVLLSEAQQIWVKETCYHPWKNQVCTYWVGLGSVLTRRRAWVVSVSVFCIFSVKIIGLWLLVHQGQSCTTLQVYVRPPVSCAPLPVFVRSRHGRWDEQPST